MFADTLLQWYADNARVLPWRGINNPYFIWLSEIILQQTRIEQGRDYYFRFIEEYPTVQHLAAASEEQVLKTWQGLGYYSRARNLHSAARYIVDELHGQFPSTYEGILRLKGVGRYTAAAIASFAFRLPHPVIDGNVYRFISRLYGIATPIATDAAYKEFEALLLRHIDASRPDLFNQALMDFGSLQCVPQHPQCALCPFSADCVACLHGTIDLFPVKAAPIKVKERWFYYFHILYDGHTLMHQRQGKDIWRGLYEFPLLECDSPLSPQALEEQTQQFLARYGITPGTYTTLPSIDYVHKLTHRTIHATFLEVNLHNSPPPHTLSDTLFSCEEAKKLPISRLIDRYLSKRQKVSADN
ncbi:MAG: A/G-specific adenine glycosylase [Bacteroidales bacterium]|nr:A/G-specific adenine glycosylase [Bacteroidales bacterium]